MPGENIYNQQNIFTGIIDLDGNIYEVNGYRKGNPIGVDLQKQREYEQTITEMQGRLDEYYSKLVELGVITPPKTAEQIAMEQAQEQQKINQGLLEAITDLKNEISELRGVNNNVMGEFCTESGINPERPAIKSPRPRSKRNIAGNPDSAGSVA
jgi:hypothetical protein